jgi:hypothetical protein
VQRAAGRALAAGSGAQGKHSTFHDSPWELWACTAASVCSNSCLRMAYSSTEGYALPKSAVYASNVYLARGGTQPHAARPTKQLAQTRGKPRDQSPTPHCSA